MNVTLLSAFRNAESYMRRYANQVVYLEREIRRCGNSLYCVFGEGDSTDNTLSMLTSLDLAVHGEIVDVTHGGPVYSSVVDAQRFKQLAYVGNKLFAAIPSETDVVVWLESDLIWEAKTIVELLDHMTWHACVAPAIMEKSTGGFYDIFAFRKDGLSFQKYAPFHPSLKPGMNKMDSVGSCVAINLPEFAKLTVPESNVIVGVCEQIRALGGGVWCDMALTVWHA